MSIGLKSVFGGANPLYIGPLDRLSQRYGRRVLDDALRDVKNSQGIPVEFGQTPGELRLLELACQIRVPPPRGIVVPDEIPGLSPLQNKKLEYVRKVAALNPQAYCNPHYRRSAASEHMTMDIASILDDASVGVLVHVPTRDGGLNQLTPYRVMHSIQRNGWGAFILRREVHPPSPDPEVIVLGRPTAQAEFESITHNLASTSGEAKVAEHAPEFMGALKDLLRNTDAENISFQGYSQGGAIANQFLIRLLREEEAAQIRTVDLSLWHAPGLSVELADELNGLAAHRAHIKFSAQINQVEHDQVHDAGDRQPFVKARSRNVSLEYLRWSFPDIAADRMSNPLRYLQLHTVRRTDDWASRPVIHKSFDLAEIHALLDDRYTIRDEEETGSWIDEMNRAAFEAQCAKMLELEETIRTRLGRRGTLDQQVMGLALQVAKDTLHQIAAPRQSFFTRAWGVTKLVSAGAVTAVAAPYMAAGASFMATQGAFTTSLVFLGGAGLVGAAAPAPVDPVGLSYDAPLDEG